METKQLICIAIFLIIVYLYRERQAQTRTQTQTEHMSGVSVVPGDIEVLGKVTFNNDVVMSGGANTAMVKDLILTNQENWWIPEAQNVQPNSPNSKSMTFNRIIALTTDSRNACDEKNASAEQVVGDYLNEDWGPVKILQPGTAAWHAISDTNRLQITFEKPEELRAIFLTTRLDCCGEGRQNYTWLLARDASGKVIRAWNTGVWAVGDTKNFYF